MTTNDLDLLLLLDANPTLTLEEAKRLLAIQRTVERAISSNPISAPTASTEAAGAPAPASRPVSAGYRARRAV
jgi:hypothetical protein